MAYSAINASEIEVGDPVTASLLGKVRGNDVDHETRLVALEGITSRVQVFDEIILNAGSFSTLTGLIYWRSPLAFTLTEAKITIFTKGSLGGTLEVDVKKNTSPNPAGFSSVFTTKPSITYASVSDYDSSTNAVFDNTAKSVDAGDFLRMDITQTATGGIVSKFILHVYGEI